MHPLAALLMTLGILVLVGAASLFHAGWLIIVGTSIWVGIDAHRLGLGKYDVGPGPTNPVVASVGCLLLWIVVFPWYLIIRGKVVREKIGHFATSADAERQRGATNEATASAVEGAALQAFAVNTAPAAEVSEAPSDQEDEGSENETSYLSDVFAALGGIAFVAYFVWLIWIELSR